MPDETTGRGWGDDGCPAPLAEALRRPVDLGPAARARLADALAAEGTPGAPPHVRARRWLVRPARWALPPLATIAAAAGLVVCGALGGAWASRARTGASAPPTPPAVAAAAAEGDPRVVRFVLVAPGAAQVALVGDFNGWDAARTPMRPGGAPGMWTVELPVSAGRHVYAFVVDGTRWVADPAAPLAPEDGFGSRNSVLVVGAET